MQVFLFDGQSGRYLGQSEAQRAPRSASGQPVWLLPSNGTFVPPPVVGGDQYAVYKGGAWKIMPEPVVTLQEIKFAKASEKSKQPSQA